MSSKTLTSYDPLQVTALETANLRSAAPVPGSACQSFEPQRCGARADVAVRAGNLELREADLMQRGSFDEAVAGADYVFHTASPYFATADDPQRDLVSLGTCSWPNRCCTTASV